MCDNDQPILLLGIVVRHRCCDATLQTRPPELGLESEYLVLGSFEVFPEFQVDLQCFFARLDVFSEFLFKQAEPFVQPHDVRLEVRGANRVFCLLNGFKTKVLSKAGRSLISIEEL